MKESSSSITRRDALALAAACFPASSMLGCNASDASAADLSDLPVASDTTEDRNEDIGEKFMQIHYLEIVTKDVDATCDVYAAIEGVKFGDADPNLGGARTAQLKSGGMLGVRAPMHDGEKAVTRAYMLVDDIQAAVAAVEKSGAKIAVPPMQIPGHGTCAIYIQGGIESGLWQI